MPGHDDTSPPASRAADDRETPHRLSRRSVLRGAAGAGVAGIAATALAGAVPAFAATARPQAPAARGAESETTHEDTTEQVVVHVRDARSGEIDMFRGTSHTRVRDPELAARLLRASH
jgi:predicted nicotinamide N-methyase